jgi:hypothetical protein
MTHPRATACGVVLLVLGALIACGRPPPPATIAPPPTTRAPVVAAVPDQASVVSVLAVAGDRTLRLRLAAPSTQSLALDNCNGAFQWGLERQAAGTWERAWGAETDACLSAPLAVAAGATREFTVAITGPDGEALGDGTYRAVVYGLHGVPASQERTELPADQRTSAPFRYPAGAASSVDPG